MSGDEPGTGKKYPLKADTVTAIATTVIAVISLFVSVFQMREARRFDTVSMTPRIEFTRHFETGAEFFGVTINNTGLGPCIVRKLEVLVDDQPFDLSTTIGWKDAVKAAGIGNRGMTYHSFEDGDILRAGVESPLVGAAYDKLTAENRDLLKQAVARMTLHITFESMYGERFDRKTQFKGTF